MDEDELETPHSADARKSELFQNLTHGWHEHLKEYFTSTKASLKKPTKKQSFPNAQSMLDFVLPRVKKERGLDD